MAWYMIISRHRGCKRQKSKRAVGRAEFYGARMLSFQKEHNFTGEDFNKIRKVFTIWICFNPEEGRDNTLMRYCLKREELIGHYEEPETDYDLLNIVMLNIGREESTERQSILRLLHIVFGNRKFTEKKQVIENEYEINMSSDVGKDVDSMCNYSDMVYERALECGMERGMERGMKCGMEQGILQGMAREKENTALEMLREKLTLSTVQKCTKLSMERLQELAKLL